MINSELFRFLAEGFGLGITMGIGCVAHCGPVYVPILMQKKMSLWESIFMVLEISAGRFVAYLAFGLAVGEIGKRFVANNMFIEVSIALSYVILSVFLIMTALGYRKEEKGCSRSKIMKYSNAPFLIGLITGIHLCPSFLIALTRGLSTKGALGGGMLFFGFYMGTNIWLMPFSMIGVAGRFFSAKNLRKGAMIASILIGAWFIGKATSSITGIIINANKPVPVVVNVMDEKPLYFVGTKNEDLRILTAVFKESRKGAVSLIDSLEKVVEDSARIFVSPTRFAQDSALVKELIAPGRFVGVLPLFEEKHKKEGFGNRYSVILATYFSDKQIVAKETGTYFHMKDMLNSKAPQGGTVSKKGKSACGSCPSASACGKK